MSSSSNSTAITCRSTSSWDALEWAVEKAAEAADRLFSWGQCREETAVAVTLTVFAGLVVLAVVLTWVEALVEICTFTSFLQC